MRSSSYFCCVFLCLLLLSIGCTRFYRVRKSSLWQEKHKAAVKYYQAGKYAKASLLLEDIMPLIRGLSEGEEGLFMYAYSQYYQKQYILSAEYFKLYARTYPRSSKAEEASYIHAYSQYLSTEPYYLDPNPTYEALDALQAFIETYPQSKDRPKAQSILDELQSRLATKSFVSAKQYYRLNYCKSAVTSLKDFARNFPDSKYVEESKSICIQAQYKWAEQSVAEKQYSRYQNMKESYKNFAKKYPNSLHLKKLTPLYRHSLQAMSEILEQKKNKSINLSTI